jgi:type II secretory pathway component PulF
MKTEDLIALNEEIAGMARAGLPLAPGLLALAREMGRGELQRVTETLAEDLISGKTLPEALEKQSAHVPPFYSGLVSAGVKTGRIAEVLATLTMYARTVANLRATIVDAFFYPAIVLVFAIGLFAFLSFVVLPLFDKIFQDFNMSLPLITQAVLALSRKPFEYVFLPALVLLLGVLFFRVVVRSTALGRVLWARLIYSVPIIGTLLRSARLMSFTELLAILIDHEIPLPEAFRLAGAASSDPVMAARAREINDDLNQGLPLGFVLKGRGLVPEWVAWMTGLGEQRGSLGKSLHLVADLYRRQVEMRAAILRSVLPPIMILLTAGLFTALFVASVMLPMIKLLEGLTK